MSLKWLLGKFSNSDKFSEFNQRTFKDLLDISAIFIHFLTFSDSNQAENSLKNSIDCENEENLSNDEFKDTRTCPDDCEHENCPFQHQLISNSEIFGTIESIYTSSSVSLLRKISSESLMNFSSENSFLKILRIFPLRDNSTIIHWSVKSFIGIRGYKVRWGMICLKQRGEGGCT